MSLEDQNKEIEMWRTMYFASRASSYIEFHKKLDKFLSIPSSHFMADKPDNNLERVLMSVSDD